MSQRTLDEFVQQWIPVRNASTSEAIPPFAAVVIDSFDTTLKRLKVKKPDADGASTVFFVSSAGIPAGADGLATCQLPFTGLYDVADGPPTSAMIWGTESGSYKLAKDKGSLRWWLDVDATDGVGIFGNSVNAGMGECVTIEVVTDVECVDDELVVTKASINRVNCTP
jgi:hypothetical protein